MADIISRAFKKSEYFHLQKSLLTYFNSTYPLPQNGYWQECRIPGRYISVVTSLLLGKQLPMESLIKIPKAGRSIGPTGNTMPLSVTWTSGCRTRNSKTLKKMPSSVPSLAGSGAVLSDSEVRSKFRESRKRSRPSPRPSNWLENPVPFTKQRTNTRPT